MLAEGGQAVKPSASGEASRYAIEGKNSRPLLSAMDSRLCTHRSPFYTKEGVMRKKRPV